MNPEQEQPIPNPEQERIIKEVGEIVYPVLGALGHEIGQKAFVVAGQIDYVISAHSKDSFLADNPALVERLKAAAKAGNDLNAILRGATFGQKEIAEDLVQRGITDKDAILQAIAPPLAEKMAVHLQEVKALLAEPSIRQVENPPAYWKEMIEQADLGIAELEPTLARFQRAHKFAEKEFYGAHIYDSEAGAGAGDEAGDIHS